MSKDTIVLFGGDITIDTEGQGIGGFFMISPSREAEIDVIIATEMGKVVSEGEIIPVELVMRGILPNLNTPTEIAYASYSVGANYSHFVGKIRKMRRELLQGES